MRTRLLIAALVGVSLFAIAVSTYALRARDSAIRGWAFATRLKVEIAELNTQQKVRDNRLNSYEKTFKWLISKNADIQPTDSKLEIAEKLTNHLYQTTLFSGPWINSSIEPQRYLMTIGQESFNYCSSLSTTLDWMLGLFGIEARSTHFAAQSFFTGSLGDTHTLVEALIDGRVIAIDPTFNTTYSCGDRDLLDAKAMIECASTGQFNHHYIAKPRPGRSLAEYYIPITKILYAIDATQSPDHFYTYEYPSKGWLQDVRSKYTGQSN
ncbi:hypothetical protein [Mesorhizobium sp. ZC-5]|uniref:hypothetical protein n=1 Tax=Mesorhizobium sp. ZC-5 TaxID=2986066 RepID=UPI0021E79CCB|nr:hypothetical protein [Mesorhizobium sp. ZC-5]MCV3243673.1 hypothetical protein [Mesorhizobium sp. ZC-5]